MVGVGERPHTPVNTSSNGFIVPLTGTLMNFCLCLVCMQPVHSASSCVYPSIRDFMVGRFIRASHQRHIVHSGIVRDFRVDLVLPAISALDDSIVDSIVYSIVGLIVDSIVDSIVVSIEGSIVCLNVGFVVSTLGCELSLFLSLPFFVVDDRSAVAGARIYVPLDSFQQGYRKMAKL